MKTVPSSDIDEIDLRAIFLTLWKARVVIIIVTLAAAIGAFVVSNWFLPRRYQASAYVYIGQPVVDIAQTDSINISPNVPDMSTVVQLSTASGLLESVLEDPTVVAAAGNGKRSKTSFDTAFSKSELNLQVTAASSQQAALLVNTWAVKVVTMVNNDYGLNGLIETLDSEASQAKLEYDQAQAALEEALSESPADALSAQVERKHADLRCILESFSQITRVLDDLQVLEQGLSSMSAGAPLPLGDGLTLTILRQRSLTSQPCQITGFSQSLSVNISSMPDFTTQIDSTSLAGLTVSDALETSIQLRAGLQTQLTRLQSGQSRLEQELPQLERDLEEANARLTLLTLQRDRSLNLYTSLLQQLQFARALTQSAQVARVSILATPVNTSTSPKTLMNTALVGVLGLILSAFGALVVNWWRNK